MIGCIMYLNNNDIKSAENLLKLIDTQFKFQQNYAFY